MLSHRRASSGWRPSIAAGADRTARHTHTRASVKDGVIRAGRGVTQRRRNVEARAAPWKRGPHFSALWISARRAGGRAERQTARGRQRTAAFGARRRAEAEAGSHLGLLIVQLRGRALDLLVQAQVVLRARTGVRSSGGGGLIRQQPNRAQQERRRRRRARTCSTICRALPSAWSVGSEKGMLFDLPGTRGPIIFGRAAHAPPRGPRRLLLRRRPPVIPERAAVERAPGARGYAGAPGAEGANGFPHGGLPQHSAGAGVRRTAASPTKYTLSDDPIFRWWALATPRSEGMYRMGNPQIRDLGPGRERQDL
eukprot:COSAG04_NODE_647_length_11596_cov_18.199878_5_plen_310_part_00